MLRENKEELFFKKIALKYAKADGLALKEEARKINTREINSKASDWDTHALDLRIKKLTRPKKRNITKWAGYISLAAACLAFIIWGAFGISKNMSKGESTQMAATDAAAETGYLEPEAAADQAMDESAANSPASDEAGGYANSDSEAVAEVTGEDAKLIPISFELPSNLYVSSSKVDQGESVYRLSNIYNDEIVLIMKEGQLDDAYREYHEETIDGYTVYGYSQAGCQLLAFEKDGITYVITCRYDMGTLIDLTQHIL